MQFALIWPDRCEDHTTPTGWVGDRVPPWWQARGVLVTTRRRWLPLQLPQHRVENDGS